MDRRTFLGWFSVGWVASSFPVALAACAKTENKSESVSSVSDTVANSPRSDGFITAGSVAKLNQDGQIFNKELPVGSVLIVRRDTNTIAAVDPTCPHKGCTVKWRANEKDFICPCHDARFAMNGKVLEGPAKEPLTIYQAKVEGDLVLVKANVQGMTGERSPENTQVQQNSPSKDDADDKDESKAGHKNNKKHDEERD